MLHWRGLRVVRYESAIIQHKSELATEYWEQTNALDNLVSRTGGLSQHRTSRELIAIVENLKQDLAALRHKNPFAKRPEIWRLVFTLAAGPINVPITEILGLERPYTNYSTFNETQVRQVIAAACQKAEISEHECWSAIRFFAENIIERCDKTLEHRRPVLEKINRLTSLPDDNELSKIARYEAHISRQFDKTLHELQRIQSARGVQRPPTPLAIDVSVESGPLEE